MCDHPPAEAPHHVSGSLGHTGLAIATGVILLVAVLAAFTSVRGRRRRSRRPTR